MFRTFNMGIGLVIAVPPNEITYAIECLFDDFGESAWILGEVKSI